jgi:serine/threonine protein kinase
MASALSAPRVLGGKYALGRVLGSGTQGAVYEAENLLVGKKVAVKVMSRDLARDGSLRDAFLTEARITARVAHPHVVDVIDLGLDREGTPFIVMELLEGETLSEILERRGPLPLPYACELMAQVLEAVAAAHREGIVHCDLKPSNVFVSHRRPDQPVVKVFDFGIAEGGMHTRRGGAGTPLYMAPEQAVGADVDARADVFAAGAMLYEMLTGEPPFPFDSLRQIVIAAQCGNFEPLDARVPGIPPEISAAVELALTANRELRLQSVHGLLAVLSLHASGPRRTKSPPSQASGEPIPLVAKPAPAQQAAPRDPSDGLNIPRAPRMPSMEDLEYTYDWDERPEEDDDDERGDRLAPHATRRGWGTASLALGAGFALGAALCGWVLY